MSPTIAFVESGDAGSVGEPIRAATQLGLDIVFLTRDFDRYAHLPGVRELVSTGVAEIILCETNDASLICDALAERPVDGLVTFADYYIEQSAAAAREIGLPGLDPDAARTARNKLLTRQAAEAAGIPGPGYRPATSAAIAVEAAEEVGLPCVVKPLDSAGSIDVRLCRSPEDVYKHAEAIFVRPVNTRGQVRIPTVLVEEFLVGHEVSVETVTFGGSTTVVAVTDKTTTAPPAFAELSHAVPSALSPELVEQSGLVASRVLDAIGVQLGVAHVELKITASGITLVEVNARVGGDYIPELVELSTGVRLIDLQLRLQLGEPPDIHVWKRRGAAVRFLTAPAGVVSAIQGVDLAERAPGVVEVDLDISEGDAIRILRNNTDRVGHVLAEAEESYVALRSAEVAASLVDIRVEEPSHAQMDPSFATGRNHSGSADQGTEVSGG